MITYEIFNGDHIDDVCIDVCDLAEKEQQCVEFVLNGAHVICKPGHDPMWLKTLWELEREKLPI